MNSRIAARAVGISRRLERSTSKMVRDQANFLKGKRGCIDNRRRAETNSATSGVSGYSIASAIERKSFSNSKSIILLVPQREQGIPLE
jgi:hypothetical protein